MADPAGGCHGAWERRACALLSLILLTLLTMALSHWLFEPLLAASTPLLTLGWFGWVVLAAAIWAFAGSDET